MVCRGIEITTSGVIRSPGGAGGSWVCSGITSPVVSLGEVELTEGRVVESGGTIPPGELSFASLVEDDRSTGTELV